MLSTSELQVVQTYVQVLGIEPVTTFVYVTLLGSGPVSVLELSRSLDMSRTQLYRRLEELQAKNLVSVEQLDYGSLYHALPFENVEAIIAQREAEVRTSQVELPAITELLHGMGDGHAQKAEVRHYYGLAGVKQALWHITGAASQVIFFDAQLQAKHLDTVFLKRFYERCAHLRITSLTTTAGNYEMYVYSGCTTFIDYTEDRQLAIELHQPAFATMIGQLFEALRNNTVST